MSKRSWEEELTCKPLDSYAEIMKFLDNPPPWISLCRDLTLHSKFMVKNSSLTNINKHKDASLDLPQTFCHFDPHAQDVMRYDESSLPKTLVCHDMANGYHDDSVIDGTENYEAYTFYNWAGIDIFCYFSHHLLTIPPLGWINVAHAHGVKVIGTLITEWAEGATFWEKVLESEKAYKNFASNLVGITKILRFDGWLLNVENKVAKPTVLLDFVRHLNLVLHQEIPHAVLIWYDSVTIQGTLHWQNGLNEKNKAFFDACDGIFTNYSWTETDVQGSAAAAGDRLTDVYIGIDVWGRNFLGGGQFNTQEAVKVAARHGCSLAIFAPAWTHEAMSTDKCNINAVAMAEGLSNCQQFMLRDRALWGSLWPFLNTRVPCALPFKTSFCRGLGRRRHQYGEVLCNAKWYNLRHQQYQPNSAHGPHGYRLCPAGSDLGLLRPYEDDKGILRFREQFESSRVKLHSSDRSAILSEKLTDSVEPLARAVETPETIQDAPLMLSMKPPREESDDADEQSQGRGSTQPSTCLNQARKVSSPRFTLVYVRDERECLEVYHGDSFNGGSCLRVHPSDALHPEHRVTRLFHCDFRCEHSLIFCVVTKELPGSREQFLNLLLFMRDEREELRVMLEGRSLPGGGVGGVAARGSHSLAPLEPGSARFRSTKRYLLLNEPDVYVPVDNSFGWTVRYYEVHMPGARVTSINCRTGLGQGPILLGQLGICHRPGPQPDSRENMHSDQQVSYSST